MEDAHWIHVGRDHTYGLVVRGRLVGLLYWLDAEPLAEGADGDAANEGWYWITTENPEERYRVARGLELRGDVGEDELVRSVEDALAAVASEVAAGPRGWRGRRYRRK